MVVNWSRARDVLKHRLDAVFGDAFATLYPDVRAPKVYLGFPASEPPFYAAVDEIVDTAEAGGGATMGHDAVSFTLRVWLCAQHADLKTASDTLHAYEDAVFGSIMADPQLCTSVDNAFPSIETSGTAADGSKRYIAAASMAINCSVWAECPAALISVVDEANAEFASEEEG